MPDVWPASSNALLTFSNSPVLAKTTSQTLTSGVNPTKKKKPLDTVLFRFFFVLFFQLKPEVATKRPSGEILAE